MIVDFSSHNYLTPMCAKLLVRSALKCAISELCQMNCAVVDPEISYRDMTV